MRHWIPLPIVEGEASRQAHADLPEGTFEREIGKEGFYGPATQMYESVIRPPGGPRSRDRYGPAPSMP